MRKLVSHVFLRWEAELKISAKPIAEQIEHEPGDHLHVAARMPDADLAMGRRTEAQAHKIAQTQALDPLRPIRSEPGGSPALGDQGRDRAIDRRAARIAPIQIGNDDLERVEGLVIECPAHARLPVERGSHEMHASLAPRPEERRRRVSKGGPECRNGAAHSGSCFETRGHRAFGRTPVSRGLWRAFERTPVFRRAIASLLSMRGADTRIIPMSRLAC